MFKAIIAALGLALTVQANAAAPTAFDVIRDTQSAAIVSQAETMGLDWKVGDQNDYSLDMGFIKGSMSMKVREIAADGIWLDQNMDLGFAGKQQASMLIDPNTGEIKKMLVNGKEQEVPKQNVEIISVTEDKITVPAGTFDCIHAVIKDKDKNEETNAWINPEKVPLSGMLKTIQPSQFGQVTVELKSFNKVP
ncbi:MAG: hypothetical protein EOP06_24890 [Proteobacteria bacterium]|nr:MAG: hypothetical protein EOP06_24890 [Pseudomonadota bacterium]